MTVKKYTEEQIIAVLREGATGAEVADLYRQYGMSGATPYNWKTKYAGLSVSEFKRLNCIRPGKPIENAFAESLIGRLRDDCLNTN